MAVASEIVGASAGVITAIVGLAVVATLVSNNANTANVIGASGSALGGALSAAEAPVTGGSMGMGMGAPMMSYGSYGGFGG